MQKQNTRLEKVDILRGVAIFLMVLFHLNYSLIHFAHSEILNFSDSLWFYLGKMSALLFIFIAGFSFFLAEDRYQKEIVKKYLKIAATLGIIAAGISLSTYQFFPEQYIRFGIIHFFTLSFLLLLVFRKFKIYNILTGVVIIIIGVFFTTEVQNQYLYFLGFTYPGFTSGDFYPIFPYFGVMLLGYSFAFVLDGRKRLDIFGTQKELTGIALFLSKMGKYSLAIYISHQIIIIGIIFVYQYIQL